ncbi:outer membrane lipoprotein chaperone LolA [Alteromonas macleodii]|uniref:Outer-membrane lipoprotein carrier protein n=1 Tax=Alteromonas macleodii TaxID=28108 RepID=A0A6T9XZ78_ALTMA|nr:outer membrane lipoprotein chaperone LolA [Alteromonas macleodii]CAB9494125.1 Outer-membrane lipoprotein carrier protein [Alteromonas macleodii]
MNKAVSVYFISAFSTSAFSTSALTVADVAEASANASVELNATNIQSAYNDSADTVAIATSVSESDAVSSSLQALLSDMKQFRAGFDQTVVDAQQNIVHEAQGTLTMTRPNKLRWETTFPDETLLVSDGEAVWNVDTFVEQVTVISQANAIKDNPIVLLTSTDEATWSKFSISQMSSGVSANNATSDINNGPALQSYQITPKEEGGQIVTLTLTFNQDDELASLNMLDAQQQISTLVFNNIETRFPVPADTFSVDIPDSFIVDDQR